jgi:hypothetical protein
MSVLFEGTNRDQFSDILPRASTTQPTTTTTPPINNRSSIQTNKSLKIKETIFNRAGFARQKRGRKKPPFSH